MLVFHIQRNKIIVSGKKFNLHLALLTLMQVQQTSVCFAYEPIDYDSIVEVTIQVLKSIICCIE